ncbi:MAG: hypothetical protein A2383_02305 [Candidatus Pacebacteria bacterium RIFOXYB1_FULL_39_46]|nr:MAG: hypothetical protein A2383_02305 [Candidatus Pacebacteria bacterium RIFOXYB1_FULL_39_46]OGJ39102.1 MAG: hypothetical protein A2182_02145 [Candidatus Pacebacteria bacterium RIFOXYA1_FULL_38_18]OGJ40198.1 MAG: hypothetical protein A2582_03860 [Candidatus Pacebacteria bacterium RIFOXYD1_FULL_39_27]OGJ41081.1 MAG: hypothetical protein A2411_01205 [Candidatus Pacebacteria bacterium RIFOXYC1_FULL_39_21]
MTEIYKQNEEESFKQEMILSAKNAGKMAEQIALLIPQEFRAEVVQAEMLMVLGGIKATSDITWVLDDFSEENAGQLVTAFNSVDIEISLDKPIITKTGKMLICGKISNLSCLEKETRESDLVPPYTRDISVAEYIAICDARGIDRRVSMGKIYSFPESAIKDRLTVNNFTEEQIEAKKYLVNRGGETYFFFDSPKQDVIEREEKKKIFLQELSLSAELQRAITLAGGRKVIRTWGLRRPEMMGVREY